MSVLLLKVLWYKIANRDETNSTLTNQYQTPVNITKMVEMSSSFGVDIKNNMLSFTLKNFNNEFLNTDGTIMFNEQDQIKLFAYYTDDGADVESSTWSLSTITEPSSTHLIKVFYVVEYKEVQNDSKRYLTIKCADKTYVLFSKLCPPLSIKPTDAMNAPEVIQKAIRYATQGQKGITYGTGSDAGVQYELKANLVSDTPSGYITSTRKATKEDGTVNSDTTFPDINYTAIWKPIYEVIKELSQPEYTNTAAELADGSTRVYGRPFFFWLDENNEFHWEYPEQVEDGTLTVGTDKILREDFTKKVFDTVNMIIYTAGDDLNGVGIWNYYYDTTTDSRSLKMKFASYTDIAKQLLEEDYLKNTSRDAGAKYQYPASYSVTPSWSSTSVASDSEYNDSLRVEAKRRGRSRAEASIKGMNKSSTRWSGNCEIIGTNYNAGDLIKYSSPNQGINLELFRISDVTHNFSKNGWFTTLTLEKDPEKVIIS